MDELFARQASVLRQQVSDYRKGVVTLNALIQRIEGIRSVLNCQTWNAATFPIVLAMEQVNATALDAARNLSVSEKEAIESSLAELEALMSHFESMP